MSQVSLFEHLLIKRILQSVILLNENKNGKDCFAFSREVIRLDGVVIMAVTNGIGDILFNAFDFDGNTPSNMSANWRNLSHIKKEFNI